MVGVVFGRGFCWVGILLVNMLSWLPAEVIGFFFDTMFGVAGPP